MNALMNIQIRVLSAQARTRIRELEAEVAMLRKQMGATGAASAGMMSKGIQPITKWGNQVQWAGRQLMYNFTLPIAIAGVAATKFALDNQKAITRVIKVYGDNSVVMNRLSKVEIPHLEQAFIALSNRFGVAQADAINIAADWAAAGASGVALAKSVGLTMETMVLGEMSATEATQALISIQAQYGQSIDELSQTIDTLNMVENQTGISMQGLVSGMARSAGVARTMGVDVTHLAAMMAALVPATGSATAAGNGLKTILSRLMSPTNEANQVMALMGINTKELAWQSLNATQRLEKMAKQYSKLDDAQKIVVASTAASRWQINRFGQLMTDINNPVGYYHRSLDTASNSTANFNQKVKELNTVLSSNPQRLKQIWVMLQNTLAKIIQPLIPAILILTRGVANLAQWFGNLSPAAQKFGVGLLVALAAIGPLARYVGALAVLLGTLREAWQFGLKWIGKFGSGLLWLAKAPFVAVYKAIMFIPAMLTKMLLAFGGAGAKAGRFLVVGFMKSMAGIGKMIAMLVSPIMGPLRSLMTGISVLWGQMLVTMKGAWIRSLGFMSAVWRAFAAGMATFTGAFGVILEAIWMGIQKSLLGIQIFFAKAQQAVYMAWLAMQMAFASAWSTIMQWAGKAWAWLMPGAWMGRIKAAFVAIPGLLMTMGGWLVSGIGAIGSAVWAAIGAMASWPAVLIGLAIAAAVGILYNFKDQIKSFIQGIPAYFQQNMQGFAKVWDGIANLFAKGVEFISKVFWMLPQSIRDAMLTVVRIIAKAAQRVYEWFSYLNPFAKHSPSLVDQVTKGMAVIKKQYASVGDVGAIFAKAAKDLAAYKKAIAGMTGGEFDQARADVAAFAASALPLFDSLVADVKALNTILAVQEVALAKQQAVVDGWEKKLNAANAALDVEEAKLQSLQDALGKLTDEYAAHQDAIDKYASTPLKGMRDMENAIFANEQAQKKLRLEMMKWEDANGSIEDMQNNMAKLAGSIEQMQGEVKDLTAAGAGSDITGPMQDQIAAMQSAYDGIEKTVKDSPIADMQKELDALARKGEEMDLEKSLKFDDLERQIQQLVDTSKELTFEEITAGIKKEQDAMALLTPQIDAATKAVEDQQKAVDAAKASRDAIQATYDAEKAKLDALQASYDKTKQAIDDITSALNDMGQAASDANSKASAAASGYLTPGAQNFVNAKGGNFPDVSGTGKQIGREGGLTDQSALIDKFTQDTTKQMDDLLGGLDMFGPIKKKWNDFTTWLQTNVGSKIGGVVDDVKKIWSDFTSALSNTGIASGATSAWNNFTSALSNIWDWAKKIYDLFKDDIKHIFDVIVDAGKKIWNEIGPELAQFKDLIPGLTKIFGFLWQVLKVVAGVIGALLIGALKIVTSILAHVLKPALDMIIGVFKNLIKIIRGVIEFVVGVFTGDWSQAWQGIKDVVVGLFAGIADIIKGAWNIIWGAVEGLINGIIDWFKWLWDELVGHSIIPDMINAIVDWFKKLPGWVWDAIISLVDKIIEVATNMWNAFKDANIKAFDIVITWFKELPGKVWDAIISLKDKIVDVAKKAWDAYQTKNREMWTAIIGWFKGLAQNVWDKVIAIKDKLVSVAKTAFEAFKSKASDVWSTTIKWISGLPKNVWDNIILIKDKLAAAAKAGFQALVDKAKEIIDGKNGFITWITGIPGRIGKLLGSIGSTVANAIKAAWNGVAGWINDHGIAAVNKVTTKFGFSIDKLPTFEGGGVIPGRVSKKDNTIIAARSGEGVIVPELVKMLGGASGLKELNHAARQGSGAIAQLGIERFADGGIIGSVTGWLSKGAGFAMSHIIGAMKKPIRDLIPGRPFAEDWAVGALQGWQDAAKKWGDKQDSMGNGVVSPIGYKTMEAILRARFGKDITFTSDYRSASSNRQAGGSATSLHLQGRAVDMTPRKNIFDFIHDTYGKHTAELFWTPQNGRNIMGGREVTIGGALAADHYDHIHWGYDKGGILKPGMTLAQNNTGRDEYTLTNADWNALSNVVSIMDRITSKSMTAGAPGSAAMASMGGTLSVLEARLRSMESQSTTATRSGGGDVTYNFYGDLEFPNITNGGDAEEFINNLKGLAS